MAGFFMVVGILVVGYLALSLGIHLFRWKTDPYYRYKHQEAEQERQFQQNINRLHQSDNPVMRDLADQLGPRRRD